MKPTKTLQTLVISSLMISTLALLVPAQDKFSDSIQPNGYPAKVRSARPSTTNETTSIAPPANDNFANATILSTSGSVSASNPDATGQAGEPFHGNGAGGTDISENNSVWYKFTAPASGVFTIGTQNVSPFLPFDSVLSAYTGSAVNNLTGIAHSDDHLNYSPHARITFGVSAGQTYYIAADGYLNYVGGFIVSYAFANVPANDNFANALDLGTQTYGPSFGMTDANVNATSEAGEPVHDPSLPGLNNSIWYKWTPTQPLSITFRTYAVDGIDTVLAVYTGSAVNNLTLITRNDNYASNGFGGSRVTFFAQPGTTYYLAIDGNSHEIGNTNLIWEPNLNESTRRFNFDGDFRADVSLFRPSTGEWWIKRSSTGVAVGATFGAPNDRPTPADFSGDRKTDIAVWRPSDGTWYILRSDNTSYSIPFGMAGDIPVPGQFDTDSKADPAVFRPSTGTFYFMRSYIGGSGAIQWGMNGDIPLVADYDGDGESDVAIYRPTGGEWWIRRSTAGIIAFPFGNAADKPVIGDYTGDGRTDVAIWRPGTGEWFVLRSEDWSYYSGPFGQSGDIPVPGDYDGDSKFDVGVFRPSSATWYIQRSSNGTLKTEVFGMSGDKPAPNAYIP